MEETKYYCHIPATSRCRCSHAQSSLPSLPVETSAALTTQNMAASSDRNPPPFPATEEPEPGMPDMADGDSDEGEDIFVSNVCFQLCHSRSICLSGSQPLHLI